MLYLISCIYDIYIYTSQLEVQRGRALEAKLEKQAADFAKRLDDVSMQVCIYTYNNRHNYTAYTSYIH
jgi:hypothetical protein